MCPVVAAPLGFGAQRRSSRGRPSLCAPSKTHRVGQPDVAQLCCCRRRRECVAQLVSGGHADGDWHAGAKAYITRHTWSIMIPGVTLFEHPPRLPHLPAAADNAAQGRRGGMSSTHAQQGGVSDGGYVHAVAVVRVGARGREKSLYIYILLFAWLMYIIAAIAHSQICGVFGRECLHWDRLRVPHNVEFALVASLL